MISLSTNSCGTIPPSDNMFKSYNLKKKSKLKNLESQKNNILLNVT